MLICPVCGKVHPRGTRNCDVCGAPLHASDASSVAISAPAEASAGASSGPICPVCRRGNRSASTFCAHCGFRLKQVSGPQPYALPYAAAAPAHSPPATMPATMSEVSGNIPSGTLLKRRYRILRKIAQGGMGAVYESTDLLAPMGTRWAIKEMSPAALPAGERTQAIADFRREAQMLATLSHPNLATVAETFEEMGKHFLVMEFIPGQTLLHVLDNTIGFVPQERIMTWARQLFDVFQYLHSQNPPIIYRDIKPANVMLIEGTERIKLIDFGIARFHRPGKSQDTEAFGTAGYAPPEQYGKGQTDQRSDVYALGATLHYLFTKHDPSLNPFNWLPARRFNPAVSTQVDSALQTALNLDPARRFQTMNEFANALGLGMPVPVHQPQQAPVHSPTAPTQANTQVSTQAPTPLKTQKPRGQSKKKPQPAPAPSVPQQMPVVTAASPVVPPAVAAPAPPSVTTAGNNGTPTAVAAHADAPHSAPTERTAKGSKKPGIQAQERQAALMVSDRYVDLGEIRWNRRPTRKIALRAAGGGDVRGQVVASHPWISYAPQNFSGSEVTLEVKAKAHRLPLGQHQLQVPNVFAIIWSRTRWVLPLIGFWFWLLVLVANSLGRYLMWGLAGTAVVLVVFWALMWLLAGHVRLLVPAPRVNSGRLLVKSSGGDQQIEVRVTARPSWVRKAIGWVAALLLFAAELVAVVWIGLTIAGINISVNLPGL